MGNGSEEQQAGARKFVEKWELFDDDLRACQLRLSGRSRYSSSRIAAMTFLCGGPNTFQRRSGGCLNGV
jgi:hypothetical protein